MSWIYFALESKIIYLNLLKIMSKQLKWWYDGFYNIKNYQLQKDCLFLGIYVGFNLTSSAIYYIPEWPIFWLKRSELHNFSDQNTILATCKSLQQLIEILEQESESAVLWFSKKKLIVNPNKFQTIILKSTFKRKS